MEPHKDERKSFWMVGSNWFFFILIASEILIIRQWASRMLIFVNYREYSRPLTRLFRGGLRHFFRLTSNMANRTAGFIHTLHDRSAAVRDYVELSWERGLFQRLRYLWQIRPVVISDACGQLVRDQWWIGASLLIHCGGTRSSGEIKINANLYKVHAPLLTPSNATVE